MTEPPLATRVTSSELNDDLSCTSCGYNLRGLRTEGNCPECATPISRSVHGNLLRYANPDWVDKLRLGSSLMLWNILLALVMGFGVGLMASVGMPRGLIVLMSFAGGLLGLVAIFMLTTPEPTVAHRENPITLRRLVRGCAAFQWLGSALQNSPGIGFGPTMVVVIGLMSLVGVVAYFGMFIFLRRFALRVPNEKLASSTRTVMWGYGIGTVAVVVGGLIAAFAAGLTPSAIVAGGPGAATTFTTSGTGFTLGVGVACFAGLCVAVFGIWYVVLLFQYNRLFKKAATESRATLAAAIAGVGDKPSKVGPQD